MFVPSYTAEKHAFARKVEETGLEFLGFAINPKTQYEFPSSVLLKRDTYAYVHGCIENKARTNQYESDGQAVTCQSFSCRLDELIESMLRISTIALVLRVLAL